MMCQFLVYSKVIQLYIHILFRHGLYFPVLYNRTLLFIPSIYNSLHLLIPNSQSIPPPPTLPLGNQKSDSHILFSFKAYFLKFLLINLFIYGCVGSLLLCVGFLQLQRAGATLSLWCAGFSLQWLLLLWSTGSRCAGSVVVAHGFSCSTACGIFPDQGSNPCPLHWQANS